MNTDKIPSEIWPETIDLMLKASKESAAATPWHELIKILPDMAWLLFWAILITLFYKPIRYQLIPKLSNLSMLGVKMSFIKESIEAAVELGKKSPQWQVVVPTKDKERVEQRAKKCLAQLQGGQILWVDDHPENNVNERRMFRQLKMDVDSVHSTEEALEMLTRSNYDIVLSDIPRGQDTLAGLDFLQRYVDSLKDQAPLPVIFYIGDIDQSKGVPGYAFGLTQRPDELLHLVIDAMERRY